MDEAREHPIPLHVVVVGWVRRGCCIRTVIRGDRSDVEPLVVVVVTIIALPQNHRDAHRCALDGVPQEVPTQSADPPSHANPPAFASASASASAPAPDIHRLIEGGGGQAAMRRSSSSSSCECGSRTRMRNRAPMSRRSSGRGIGRRRPSAARRRCSRERSRRRWQNHHQGI